MVRLIKLVIAGIYKMLFPLWFTVIAVSHHQVPVNILLHHILRCIKGIGAFSDILDNGSTDAGFFFYFPKSRLLVLFSCFYSSLWQNPALILVLVILVENQNLAAKYNHTSTARCFYHCNPSWSRSAVSAPRWCVAQTGFSITPFDRRCNMKFP